MILVRPVTVFADAFVSRLGESAAKSIADCRQRRLGEFPDLLQLLPALWGSGISYRPDFQPFPHGAAQLSLQLHLAEPVQHGEENVSADGGQLSGWLGLLLIRDQPFNSPILQRPQHGPQVSTTGPDALWQEAVPTPWTPEST